MARRSIRPPTQHVVLVIDDQPDTVVSVRSLLEREGHEVLCAESGEQALGILKAREVHCIIVDYFMPRMNGAEFVREVRTFDPFVQIILQTGYAGEKPPRMMLGEMDIQGYHYKTDDPERLLLWVDVGLKTYRLLRTLRDREQLQSELVANCSHEFRTPLNVIIGYAELLLGGNFGTVAAPAMTPLKSIEEAARGLSDMVADFLQYAKLDAGMSQVAPEWIDVETLGREIERLAILLLEDKGVAFTLDLEAAPQRFFSDGVKVRTILRNLVTNAAKFTDKGSVALRVVIRDGALRIEVRDTGPGIRPEDHELVFQPFRQLDGSSTRQHGGVGLGLALSRKLARTLGGDLEVMSAPGAGSTFSLVMPAEHVRVTTARPPIPCASTA